MTESYIPGILRCLELPSYQEARQCLLKHDIQLFRILLYTAVVGHLVMHRCSGPITLEASWYDEVTVVFHSCGQETEAAIWSLVELLEDLPGVWYVETRREGDTYTVRTIPLQVLGGGR